LIADEVIGDEQTIILQKRLQSLDMKARHRFVASSALVAFLTAILAWKSILMINNY